MVKNLFLLLGMSGAGKTTNAESIAKNNIDITHYSMGDIFRSEVKKNSSEGKKIKKYVCNGVLVPIDIAIETIIKTIRSARSSNILIDGYPRDLEQMNKLNEYLQKNNDIELVNVIEIVISEDVARERVLSRFRGKEDNNEVFDHRMIAHKKNIPIIRDFYKEIFVKVNGEKSVKSISNDIEKILIPKLG